MAAAKQPRSAPRGLTAARARECLSYDPLTGIFTHRFGRGGKREGAVAGSVLGSGYIYISIDDHPYLAHQLAWLMMTGEWPSTFEIDHEDTVRTNNVWANLRPATQAQQKWNASLRKDNPTGFKGVMLRESGRWQARIRVHGKTHYLGTFATPEEAAEVRRLAAERLHGAYARAA